MTVDDLLAQRDFADPRVRVVLDALSTEALETHLGPPRILERFAEPQGYWSPGQPRPPLADADPPAMQLMGQCAASRFRDSLAMPRPLRTGAIHPTACGWCDYPLRELLAALDWATWSSRYLIVRLAVWRRSELPEDRLSAYVRELAVGEYQHPAWKAWWALSRSERARRLAEPSLGLPS